MRILMLNYEYPPLGGGGSNACMKEIKSYPVDPVDPVKDMKSLLIVQLLQTGHDL